MDLSSETGSALIYEGEAKKLYSSGDPEMCVLSYKDDAIAYNGLKKGTIPGKGAVNNQVSARLMTYLNEHGIPTHFVRTLSPTEALVRRVRPIPLEVVVRNVAVGTMAESLGLREGLALDRPVVEFHYKNAALNDPLVNEDHILALKWAAPEEIAAMRALSLEVNRLLSGYLSAVDIDLVDFKLEYGVLPDGSLALCDEISPDTCRLWDRCTGEKLDMDRFRLDMGGVKDAYLEAEKRIMTDVAGGNAREGA